MGASLEWSAVASHSCMFTRMPGIIFSHIRPFVRLLVIGSARQVVPRCLPSRGRKLRRLHHTAGNRGIHPVYLHTALIELPPPLQQCRLQQAPPGSTGTCC